MKYCAKCQRTYEDENLSYCLQDGMTLVHSDPQAETFEVREQKELIPQPSPNAVEMINENVTLNIGDYYDLKTKFRTIRITFKDVVTRKFSDTFRVDMDKEELAAQLHINTEGGLVFGGKDTIEHGTNEYLVPVKISNLDEPRSAYYFYSRDNQTAFFRVLVEHINQHRKKAELNIAYLRCSKYD